MDLSLEITQKQILSQRMQQSVEILQMDTLALSEYAKDIAQENPLLEWEEEPPSETEEMTLLRKLEWLEEADEQNRGFYKEELEDTRERDDSRFTAIAGGSLREYLLFQIGLLKETEETKRVLRFLAESTEASGYLEEGAQDAARKKYGLTEKKAEELLTLFQNLDPAGVGARDLRECLLIQLEKTEAEPFVLSLVKEHLEDLGKNRIAQIAKAEKVTKEAVLSALAVIRECEPKPGRCFADASPVEYVMPDVFVEREGKGLSVRLNSGTMPALTISRRYMAILRGGADEKTKEYLTKKLKQAEWVMQCIRKRESTLLETARCIADRQQDFFLNRDGELSPLRMADVAEALSCHESTVSRAVQGKYIQCERGVFPMHYFFSTALGGEGEKAVSAESVKNRLKKLIEAEDRKKPLSDRALTEQLEREGIRISRRTAAKYRESMGIPTASGRKQS